MSHLFNGTAWLEPFLSDTFWVGPGGCETRLCRFGIGWIQYCWLCAIMALLYLPGCLKNVLCAWQRLLEARTEVVIKPALVVATPASAPASISLRSRRVPRS